MMRLVLLVLFCFCLAAPAAGRAEESSQLTPHFDLRVRQEVLDGVLYFAADPDRNQLRFRTRGGASYRNGRHTLKVLLSNEHRRFLHPDDVSFDWDELIIDNLLWKLQNEDLELTVGRQNIIWDDGFLMLEGQPLDGSRTIAQDAVRLNTTWQGHKLDMAFILNSKRDPWILAGDEDRNLRDADELGFAARFERQQNTITYIFKQEDDPDGGLPDLTTHTLSSRFRTGSSDQLAWKHELVGQYQIWQDGYRSDNTDLRFAGLGQLDFNLAASTRGHAGLFFYAEDFRTPWGRWPLWSELYIYTLIGESTPNRVHVAAWEDVAGPYVGARRNFSDTINGKLRAYYLMSPASEWDPRGFLVQARLDFQLHAHARSHLLWEMLNPGAFHSNRTPLLDETVHFLRWEVILNL